MENREQQILSEIKSMMASIRSQLELLDAKMAELQQIVDPEEFEAESIDLDIDVDEAVDVPAAEEVAVDDDLPFADVPDEPETVEVAAEADDDLPAVPEKPEPEVVTVVEKAAEAAKPTINDMLAADCAWRRDMPGAQVRDVRSAISLNDRVIFINLLFNEDAQCFVDALAKINAMETLDQAVEYVTSSFPEWDMNSELVYRFMMAVRRKLR